MNHLFNAGKSLFKKNKHGDDESGGGHSSSGGGGLGNPMAILKTFDRDGDGNITENDFVLAIQQMGLGSVGESAVRAAFKKLDKNHNGKLDFSEALGLVGVVKDLFSKNKKTPE